MTAPTLYTFQGETLPLREWARRLGHPNPDRGQSTLRKRIEVLGWPVEKALTLPVRRWVSADMAFARGRSKP